MLRSFVSRGLSQQIRRQYCRSTSKISGIWSSPFTGSWSVPNTHQKYYQCGCSIASCTCCMAISDSSSTHCSGLRGFQKTSQCPRSAKLQLYEAWCFGTHHMGTEVCGLHNVGILEYWNDWFGLIGMKGRSPLYIVSDSYLYCWDEVNEVIMGLQCEYVHCLYNNILFITIIMRYQISYSIHGKWVLHVQWHVVPNSTPYYRCTIHSL